MRKNKTRKTVLDKVIPYQCFTSVVKNWWNHNLPEVVARTDRANRAKCLRVAARVIAKNPAPCRNRGGLLGVVMDSLDGPWIGQNEGHLDAAILAEQSLSQALSEPRQFHETPASSGSLCK